MHIHARMHTLTPVKYLEFVYYETLVIYKLQIYLNPPRYADKSFF
jgi:hypothetical protein